MTRSLNDFPRARFAHLPSALDPLANLTRTLRGPQLWVKRDDQIGLGIGGNKARKLEFLMGAAIAKGTRKVVTFGGLQSNHTRQTASAARRLGLEPHLFLLARQPKQVRGNLLLDELTGACIHFVGRGVGRRSIESAIRMMWLLARRTPGLHWRDTYVIPVGGHSPIGALGYVNAAFELTDQARERGLQVDDVVTAAGTGGTMAGLMAGFALRDTPTRVIGVNVVGDMWTGFRASIARLATRTVQLLGGSRHFTESDVELVEGFVGKRYGVPTPQGVQAIRLLAETEGLFLDPVYTAKAMVGLINLVRQERFHPDENVVFLHTGGTPALFAFDELPGG